MFMFDVSWPMERFQARPSRGRFTGDPRHRTEGEMERKFEAGAQAVSETLSERIGKERIRLGTPVLRVEHGAEHVRVISEDGQSFEGLYAISAIPHAILPTVHFHPPLPTLKRLLINRMPMGSVIKVVTFYKTAFWKEKGFNGCTMSDSGCVTFSMDDTKPDGSHPAMMGFIQAETARRMCLDTPERRKASVCQHYARIFKMEEFLHPVDYVEKNWTEEAYSGGCYSSTFGPGVLTSFGEALRQPVGRIHFAGTELASQWPGYMDGAVQSGERAAREVLRQLGRNGSEEISQAEAPLPLDCVSTPEGGFWLARVLPHPPHSLLHFGGIVLAAGLAWFFQSKL
ncbi:amine oxidase [flavin-containing] B-like, partial [Chiloscyllium punctatum]|uniref:amine oxidase [flavin-containing] B-like n=1 Tax=Chiloscyllium punctatum TaxID=137246 RepID=UPI003B631E4B